MGALHYLTIAFAAAWIASEAVFAVLTHSRPWAMGKDRLSYWTIWLSFALSILAALRVSKLDGVGGIPALSPFLGYAGCAFMAGGVAVRWVAVLTLGRQFKMQVTIVKGHKLVDHGIYRNIRHPSYLGLLVSFVGLGFALQNWICLSILFLLPLASILYRISTEEKVLADYFGVAYVEYRKKTKRLLPGVY